MEFTGKTAIVTGGAVRLGRAITLELAKQNVNVVLHYGQSAEAAEHMADEIRALGVEAITVQADLRTPQPAACRIVERAVEQFGPPDILINNAAIFEPSTLADQTVDGWERHVAINLAAPLFLSQQFAASGPAGQRRHIVSIADWRGTTPVPGHLAYTVAKGGLVTLTKLLAQELAPDIQVNAVAPGAVLPPPGQGNGVLEELKAQIPLNRTGAPGDVTQTLLMLLRSDFITGEIIHVTGGQQLGTSSPPSAAMNPRNP